MFGYRIDRNKKFTPNLLRIYFLPCRASGHEIPIRKESVSDYLCQLYFQKSLAHRIRLIFLIQSAIYIRFAAHFEDQFAALHEFAMRKVKPCDFLAV